MFVRYDQLEVYKQAFELACTLHEATQAASLPKFEQYGGLADQIRRASKSICANMAEGLSKNGSLVEERRFLGLALGSCEEVQVWLSFGQRFGYWTQEQCDAWRNEYRAIARVLQVLMKKREEKVAA